MSEIKTISEAEHQEAQRNENMMALQILSSLMHVDKHNSVTIPVSFMWQLGQEEYEIERGGDSYADDVWNVYVHGEAMMRKLKKTGTWKQCLAYVHKKIAEY